LGTIAFSKLSQEGKVDYVLMKARLTYELRLLDRDRKLMLETAPRLPFAGTIGHLHETRRRMETMDPRAAAATLDSIRSQIDQVRRAVEAGLKADAGSGSIKTTRIVALRASENAVALRQLLQQWFRFYDGYDPMFSWWADTPYKGADKSLEGYVAFLRERIVGAIAGQEEPIVGDPIGRDALLVDLEREMVPYTPEELLAIGEKEYAWCLEEAKKASREMGLGDDWKAALERVKNIYVDPGRQTDLIRDLAFEAIDFVEGHQLVTVPPLARDIWRIEMMTPERQRVNPFFLGGEIIQVSYPTDTMEHAEKLMSMRGNANRHVVLAHAPRRPDRVLAWLPPGKDEPSGSDRLSRGQGRSRTIHRRGRGAALVQRHLFAALSGGLSDWRAAVPRPAPRARRFQEDDRQGLSRRHPAARPHAGEMVRASLTSQTLTEDYRAHWRFY
jgi:hypothetical protein